MFVVALIAMLFAAAQGLTCPCNDNPPSSDFSCEDQVSFGQCGADFMSGYCECACQVCAYEEDSMMMMMMPTAPETEMSMMTMDEAPEVEKPKSEKALARAAEKAAAKAARQAEKAAEKAAAKAARKAERQAAKAAEKAAEEAAESG
eukprot:TRINITY_DN399_c0_g1_i7.p3 TRINITY_DN399_c0_g1~~TRINITY_DN399_c0_g1_i7.p3  ORF type:complete len:147 (-),score=51.24 TRINITY_DN399_c0_g1_i7:597-1037(-)